MDLGQHISDHGTQLALGLTKGAAIGGVGTTAVANVAQQASVFSFLSMPGPEVVNACAMAGFAVGAIGVIANVAINWHFKKRQHRLYMQGKASVDE